MMAGFNEQTLFAVKDGTLVSVIRGRDHPLQRLPDRGLGF